MADRGTIQELALCMSCPQYSGIEGISGRFLALNRMRNMDLEKVGVIFMHMMATRIHPRSAADRHAINADNRQ